MNDLLADLAPLAALAEGTIWQLALVFFRIGAMVALLPGTGEIFLSQRIKLAVALAMTLIVAPSLPPLSQDFAFTAILTEAATGLILGFNIRLMILGLQTTGTIIAQSVSLSQIFNGVGPEPQPIIANLLALAGTALFLTMGGLARATELLILSYDLIPAGTLLDAALFADWGLQRIVSVFSLAFSLAAPFVVAALLYQLALGAINRAMPALMVTFIGAPALTFGGLVMLMLASPLLLKVWQGALVDVLAAPLGG